jgi:L-ascorbate 6-phosphate lactonase
MPLSLMDEIRGYQVRAGKVALWWLGQMGFIFKSPAGTTLGVDLYLSDTCAASERPLDLSRRVPVLIEPEELEVDVFACTHNHRDHTDPGTIARLRRKDSMLFAGPPPSCESFRRLGAPPDRIRMLWAGAELEHADLRLRATFALPTDAGDLNHLGYAIRFEGGPLIYLTGDTAWHELVAEAAPQQPDVLITCINGGFANLCHWEAAGLAARIRPKVAIPCHYDMFPDNAADPRQFRAALLVRAPAVRYHALEHGRVWVYPDE